MDLNYNNLPEDVRNKLAEARKSPLRFAENFLKVPDEYGNGTLVPFKATYPQKFVMETSKRDNWFAASRRSGKCLTGNSRVIDPITLRPTTLDVAMFYQKTLCFDFDSNKVIWAPCKWMASGEKRCLRLYLGTGVDLELSEDHLLFHYKKGWIKAEEIKIGDKILAPTEIPVFGNIHKDKLEIGLTVDETIMWNKIPDIVFQYDKETLKLWLADFWFEKGRLLHNEKSVTFMVWNKEIALDLHHLLLRFAISSRIDEDFNVYIDEYIDLNLFLNLVNIDLEVYEVHSPRKWEIITGIKKIGNRPVYDLTVDHKDHNFIANDVVVHNSFGLMITAIWHAINKPNQKVLIFTPSTTQIDELFGVINTLINTNDILHALKAEEGNFKNPHQRVTFINGSFIAGYIMGMTSNTEGGKRGLTADVVICFPYEEKVLTDIGEIPIGDIVEKGLGSKVLTYNTENNTTEWKPILRRITNPLADRKLLKVTTNKTSFTCTEDHPIFTKNRGYVKAKNLNKEDILLYNENTRRHKTDGYRETSFSWSSYGRRILLIPGQGLQKCKDAIQTKLKTARLPKLEIPILSEMVQFTSKSCSKLGLWKRVLCSEYNMPQRFYRAEGTILSTRKEGNNSGNLGSNWATGLSSLVWGRWFNLQEFNEVTYRRIFTRGEPINCSTPIQNVERAGESPEIKNILDCGNTKRSQEKSCKPNSTIASRLYAVQNKVESTGRKSLQTLQKFILSRKKYRNSLLKLQEDSLCSIQERVGEAEKTQKVYDLTVADNHNFFINGGLVSNCDESQEFSANDWKVIVPIMVGDKFRTNRMKNYISGTINNPVGLFYDKIFKAKPTEKEQIIRIPITENKDYTPEQVEEMRQTVPADQWITEYLLEVGEANCAVFRKSDIDRCGQFDWTYSVDLIKPELVRFIGVDWDKVQAGTNIAVFQYDPVTRVVQLIYRQEIDRDKFTYTNACNTIIELYEAFDPQLIIADQGQGEMQWEYLNLESQRRRLGLAEKLVKVPFNTKVELPNPSTGELEKKPIKPFLVGQLQAKFQEFKILIPTHDDILRNQLLAYKVERITPTTTKYSTHNEHIIDCCLFAMYGIWYLYENILESDYVTDHSTFKVYKQTDLEQTQENINAFWENINGLRQETPSSVMYRSELDMFRDTSMEDFLRDR